jgi:hypothetical protein
VGRSGVSFGPADGKIDVWDLMVCSDHWHEGVGETSGQSTTQNLVLVTACQDNDALGNEPSDTQAFPVACCNRIYRVESRLDPGYSYASDGAERDELIDIFPQL